MASPLGAPAVTLYLVRHGAAAGAEGRCIGRTDLPLAPDAPAALARLAAAWPPPHPPRLVSSDLTRARDSAAILAAAWHVPATTAPRLREMDFGTWDGRPWSDLERDDPAALAAWMAAWHDAPTPRGESFGDLIARTATWLHDTVASARLAAIPEIAAVAHAGSIRALLVHALQLPRSLAFRLRVDHARVTALRLTGDDVADTCTSAELLFSNADRPPEPVTPSAP